MEKHFFRVWHRRIGLCSFLMILWLALSGLIINHSNDFSLNQSKINWPWLNKLYGLEFSPESIRAHQVEGIYYFCYEGELYRDAKAIEHCAEVLQGGLRFKDRDVLLTEHGLLVLNAQGQVIDQIPFSLLGHNFSELFLLEDQLVLAEGTSAWSIDLISLEVKALELNRAELELRPRQENAGLILPESIYSQLSFPGVSLEQLLLDAHSGRLLGTFGVLLVDFFALAFMVLAISGLLIYFKKSF